MPTVGTFLQRKQNQITEKIGDSVVVMGHGKDPIWRGLSESTANITQMNEQGPSRGYRIRQRFQHRTAGVIEGGAVNNQLALQGDQTTNVSDILHQQNAEQVWPDPTQGANTEVFGLTADLHSFLFNMGISNSELKLDMNDANIARTIAGKFEGAGNLIFDYATNQWYTDSSKQYRLADLPGSGNGIDASTRTITFEPVNEASHRFNVGMTVDLWSDTTTRINETDGTSSRIPMFVQSVDLFTDTVTLVVSSRAEDGTAIKPASGATDVDEFDDIFTSGKVNGSFVTFANQFNTNSSPKHQGMFGYHDFFKFPESTSTDQSETHIFGDQAITSSDIDFINVLERPEFRSMYYNAGGYLTERDLKHVLSRTKRAFMRNGYTIDTMVAADGIADTFDDQLISKERIDRTDRPSTLNLGFNGEFQYVHNGTTIAFATSQYLEKDRIIGYRRADNYSIVTTPRLENSNASSITENAPGRIPLEFVAGVLDGKDSPHMPVQRLRNGVTVPTDMSQLPAQAILQFMPRKQIPGLVIEGITNNRIQGGSLTSS